MPCLQLKALDTLFFRNGRPFSMGQESWAEAIFPPLPGTVRGLLRSLYMARHPEILPDLGDPTKDPTIDTRITAFLPMLNGQVAFPIPADLYGNKRKPNDPAQKLQYITWPEGLRSNQQLPGMLQTSQVIKVQGLAGKAFLDQPALLRYLNDDPGPYPFHRLADYTVLEPKVGIGRDRATHTAENGKLYRVPMRRLEGKEYQTLSFAVRYEELPDHLGAGLSRFGADSKAIAYEPIELPPFPEVASIQAPFFLKLYLASPAIFQEGAVPASLFKQSNLELIAAATPSPLYAGGFDIKARRPKPMYRAVPAGTVYYLKAKSNKDLQALVDKVHDQSIYNLTEQHPTYEAFQRDGFGHCFVGRLNATEIE